MKFSKSEFKSLIKECIGELIQDGAFNKVIETVLRENAEKGVNLLGESSVKGDSESQQKQEVNQHLKHVIEATANAIGNGPRADKKDVFAKIIADTAMTTLQEQQGRDFSGLSSGMPAAVASPDFVSDAATQQGVQQLEALSNGKGMKHWAKIAFANKKKK